MKHAIPASPCSGLASPTHRHKFLCSHGGKILPRPIDGHLKYVGGETRCISVPRGILYQEVMKMLTYLIDGEMMLKYQLVTEDLDALVTVRSDEDVAHMFDEMDHYQTAGCQRMHAFLFPANQMLVENQTEPIPVDQLYIYSINAIKVSPSTSPKSQQNSPHPHNYKKPERLVSVKSVGRNASREISQSFAKCIVHHHTPFYDTRILRRQATFPAHF